MGVCAQLPLSQFVRKQQSALQLLASMSVVMALHHSFRHENRALHRRVFRAGTIKLLDQRPKARNGLLSSLFTDFNFGHTYFGGQNLVLFLAAYRGLQCLLVKRMSSLEIVLIEERITLERQRLRNHAVVLQ